MMWAIIANKGLSCVFFFFFFKLSLINKKAHLGVYAYCALDAESPTYFPFMMGKVGFYSFKL